MFRPDFHYTPARNWLSDPNGLLWHDGEYHLYYQYNPIGDQWGHMSWGHAVSRNLVDWEELPVAIAEDAEHMIFSGSAVARDDGAIIAYYTGAARGAGGRQVQCMAISHDRGRSFEKYADNPVLDIGRSDFRDPKVFWYAPGKLWIMVAVVADESRALIYRSTDMTHWQAAGTIGPFDVPGSVWECPDLIELPVEGEGRTHWLFKVDLLHLEPRANGASAIGVTGMFDGERFTPDLRDGAPDWQWIDQGSDFYAAIAWNGHAPDIDGPVWIGWLGNHGYQAHLPACGWRGAMSLPRRISLVKQRDGSYRLRQRPLDAHIARMTGKVGVIPGERLPLIAAPLELARGLSRAWRLRARRDSGEHLAIRIAAGDGTVGLDIDWATETITIDRAAAGHSVSDDFRRPIVRQVPGLAGHDMIDLWFGDHAIELFVGDGLVTLSSQLFLSPGPVGITLSSRTGLSLGHYDLSQWQVGA